MKKGLRFLATFALSIFWVFSLYASEETPSARDAYRRSTLEELVLGSQRESVFSRSSDTQHNGNSSALFPITKDNVFVLDPDNTFAGDVVEA